jgi:hypothetical protein
MANWPAPYVVDIFYRVQGQLHKHSAGMILSTEPEAGVEFDTLSAITKNGSLEPLDVVTDTIVSYIKPFYGPLDDILFAELWHYLPESFERQYIASYEIGAVGTGTAGQIMRQMIMSFRSSLGGVGYVNLLEGAFPQDTQTGWPFPAGAANAFATYVFSTASPYVFRDNGRPVTPINLSYGQNEKMWRKRFRPS